MREKEAYRRPEMEVLRFGNRTIITNESDPCECVSCVGQVHVTVYVSDPNGGSSNGCGYDIRLPVFGT